MTTHILDTGAPSLARFAAPCAPAEGWTNAYVGAPFLWRGRDPAGGWDCWGLVEWVLQREFGIRVPEFCQKTVYRPPAALTKSERQAEHAEIIADAMPLWREVAPGAGAVALFNIFGQPLHVGVMVSPARFLHVTEGTKLAPDGAKTAVENRLKPLWKNRFRGCYVPV